MEITNSSLVPSTVEIPMNIEEEPKKTSVVLKKRIIKLKLPKRQPLKSKKAVEFLLSGTLIKKVCRYCLFVDYSLHGMEEIMNIAGQHAIYKVKIRDIVASFYPFKISTDPDFPNRICNKCLNAALKSYLFVQQCEQSERALYNWFSDIYDKVAKLDPLERVHKSGRQKKNPNHNVVTIEHNNVIDYAEPIQHLISTESFTYTNEPKMSELECKKCWQILPSMESLINHEKSHPKAMWYNCRMCGKSYSKIYHFRKHIKRDHTILKPVVKTDQYHCKDCTFNATDLNIYLQHIEKHKFKEVLEHLVNQDMDKLCSICLDKGKKMLDMSTNISLYGGYPELRGSRSLYNIVGSTVPEKLYKYQELLIPNQANIMSIVRKRKMASSEEEITTNIVKHLKLTPPIIVSKIYIDMEKIYNYIFAKPSLIDENDVFRNKGEIFNVITNTIKESSENTYINNDINFKDDINNLLDKDLTITKNNKETNNLVFIFSKPEYLDIAVEDEKKNVPKEETTILTDKDITMERKCKTCWIFKSNGCKTCIFEENIANSDCKVNQDSSKEKNNDAQCKFCYIFAKSAKCEYCKKDYNKSDTKTDDNQTDDNEFTDHKMNLQLKRKLELDHGLAKKIKWTCPICLINNDGDHKICICCDSEQLNNSEANMKVNFGKHENVFMNYADTVIKSDRKEIYISEIESHIDKRNNNMENNEDNFNNNNKTSKTIEDMTLNINDITEEFDSTKMNIDDDSNIQTQGRIDSILNEPSVFEMDTEEMITNQTDMIEQNFTTAPNNFNCTANNLSYPIENNLNMDYFENENLKAANSSIFKFEIGTSSGKGKDYRNLRKSIKRTRAYK